MRLAGGGILLVVKPYDAAELARRHAAEAELERSVAGRWRYERVGYDTRSMELSPGGAIAGAGTTAEQFWRIDLENGLAILTIASATQVVCRLALCQDQVWRGRWISHERMLVELMGMKLLERLRASSAALR